MEVSDIKDPFSQITRENEETVKIHYIISPNKNFVVTIRGSHLKNLEDDQIQQQYQSKIQNLIEAFNIGGDKVSGIKNTPTQIQQHIRMEIQRLLNAVPMLL